MYTLLYYLSPTEWLLNLAKDMERRLTLPSCTFTAVYEKPYFGSWQLDLSSTGLLVYRNPVRTVIHRVF